MSEEFEKVVKEYIEKRLQEQEQKKPCPTCGHCPTCGRSKLDPIRFVPRVPDPWTPYFLQERYTPTRTSDGADDYGWFKAGRVVISCG